jgi:acetylornithine deacetylase/succinyl-diaminopimelate desuccinylase-like protein
MTIAPTIVHGGTKLNVIPDQVEVDLDVRTLPGQSEADVRSLLAEAIGDLGDKVDIVWAHNDPASESPVGTPLWHELAAMVKRFHPGAEPVPYV